ncbi:MAG: hypothetical protein PUP91_22085 [Rhizonema sp. PD37]|nr:hypothetical protein [Rhizonema sp. PD37]
MEYCHSSLEKTDCDHAFWRRNFHPGDPTNVTEQIKRQADYVEAIDTLKESYRSLLAFLKKSVPFFSMRYQGLEGSKPGAAAASVYLSHKVIRPTKSGYGKIIGKSLFNCKKLYARLLCMARPEDRFIVVPVPRLPAEISGTDVEQQIQLIRDSVWSPVSLVLTN